MLRASIIERIVLILPAILLMAAKPRLSPPPPGVIVNEVSAPFAGGGAYTVAASRAPRGTDGLFQYFLSIYAAWPGAAWHLVYAADKTLIPEVVQGHGTQRFFPDQSLVLGGTVSFSPNAAAYAIVTMHNAAADCGEGRVILLGPLGGHRFGPAAVIANPCALSAAIEGDHLVLTGPYYAKGAPLFAPTIPKARAVLRMYGDSFLETPAYFSLESRLMQPAG